MGFNHIATSTGPGSGSTMGPAPLPQSKANVGFAVAAGPHIVQPRTDYVVINQTGSYHFLYQTTGSIGGEVTGSGLNLPGSGNGAEDGAEYYHAINVTSASGGGQRLDIGVVAWSGSDYDHANCNSHTGDVTFGYSNGYGLNEQSGSDY